MTGLAPADNGFFSEPGLGVSPGMTDWRYCSRLQLASELFEEVPIRTVGNDLLRARLDQAGLVQPESVEPKRVVGIPFAP